MNAMSDLSAAVQGGKRQGRYRGPEGGGGGERGLAAAVIMQAWNDCSAPNWNMEQRDYHDAWEFLTARAGTFAEARALWCDMREMDAETVRRTALASIDYAKGVEVLAAMIQGRKASEYKSAGGPSANAIRKAAAISKMAAVTGDTLQQMRAEGKTRVQMAAELGISDSSVKKLLRSFGVRA
jgi:hypothetical protein